MSVFAELKRRNVFKVAAAYIIVSWLLLQVSDTLVPALHLPEWFNSGVAFLLIIGFPIAMIFAWAFEMTPEGLKKEKDVDRSQSIAKLTGQKLNNAIIGILVVALVYFAFDKFVLAPKRDADLVKATQAAAEQLVVSPPADTSIEAADDKSIAVLPFVNMSSDPEQEYFSDGITEEVLNLLAKIPELKVTSRSSAFSFKGQNIDIPTVAKKLGVTHVLEGSVRKFGTRVRITAQLIEADSDVHMWSETYDRELNDIFAIQDEIAGEVVKVLQIQLLGESNDSRQTKTAAYTAYLKGQHFLQLESPEGWIAAHDAFSSAIEIDPEYAPAWAGLGQTLRRQANWGEMELKAGTQSAREAVLKALELDDTLDEAWATLARLQWVYDWDWVAAEGTINTALTHGPHNTTALIVAANIAKTLGHYERAIELATQAVDLDPLNAKLMTDLSIVYWEAGRLDEATRVLEHLLSLHPGHTGAYARLSVAKAVQGKAEEAWQLVQKESSETAANWAKAMALHALGRDQEASQVIDYMIENYHGWMAYQIATIYAMQDMPDKAFEWLEISYEQRDGGITHILGDPTLNALHDDSRWQPYLLKLGLLDAWSNLQKERAGANT